MSTPIEKITNLHQEGKLPEALKEINKALKDDAENLELKQAAADVYYDLMQQAHDAEDNAKAFEMHEAYQALALPETELARHDKFKLLYRRLFPEYHKMQEANKLSKSGHHLEALAIYEDILTTLPDLTVAFVNVGWCIYRLLAEMAPKDEPDIPLAVKCLNLYSQFEIHGPSNLHSQMLRISLYFKDYPEIPVMEFIEGWDFNNFREEDLEPFRANGGNTIPSLRERAYLTYSKLLAENMKSEDETVRANAIKFTREFLPEMDLTLQELPRNVWLPYSRAMLLAGMGKKDRAKSELIYFIKGRPNEFWAWAALAEMFIGEDDPVALACYSKAMLLPSQGELAMFVAENLAALLVQYQYYSQAKTEIEIIFQARKKKAWKISKQMTEWRESAWYGPARAMMHNKSFYISSIPKADTILWSDVPDEIAIVTHVDKEKAVFYYAVNKQISGKANLKGPASRVRVGDILAVKLKEMETAGNKWYKILSLRSEPERIPEEITQFIDEYVQVPRGRDFGFLKPSNVYVAPDVVRSNNLQDGDRVSGICLLSFNKQKNEWGWKLLAVDQVNEK